MRTALGVMVRSLVAAAVLAAPAFAAPDNPLQAERFTAGAFLEAADVAETSATADDLAFAARSVLAYCFTGETRPDPALLDRATRNAEAALAIDPAHQESRLQLAIALALKSRDMGAMDVWNSGIGEKGRKLAAEVLKANPVNYYAHGYLAVWHVEVRRRAGSIGSGFMGASVDQGRKHYAEAARLAPDDVGVHWQFARALAGLDARKYRDEIGAVLASALAASADDRVEQVMQARAVRLSAAMQADTKQAGRLALELM
jgi:hypothetical protein